MRLDQVKRCKQYSGRKELVRILTGQKVGLPGILKAKCFECMGGYADGPYDCGISDCPIYPRMPYRGKIPTIASVAAPNSATGKHSSREDTTQHGTTSVQL